MWFRYCFKLYYIKRSEISKCLRLTRIVKSTTKVKTKFTILKIM